MKNFTQTLVTVIMAFAFYGIAKGQYTNPKASYLILGSESTGNYDYIGYDDAGIEGLTTKGVFHFHADDANGASALNPTAGISVLGTYSPSTLKVKTEFGYIDVGAQNQSWAHIYTDRPNFIFNKPVYATNGFHSYNGNLNLQAASGYYVQVKPGSSSYGLILREYNSSDYGNIEVTSDGLGFGYNKSGYDLSITTGGDVRVNDDLFLNFSNWMGFGPINEGSNRLLLTHTGIHGYIDYKDNLHFRADKNWISALTLYGDGSVGVGFGTTYNAGEYKTQGYKFAVNGKILSEGIKCITDVPNSDYVFENDYDLMKLEEVEQFVKQNKHLPEVPSAKNFREEGYNMGEFDDMMLRKIEELTLYIIEQNKKIVSLQEQLDAIQQ